VAASFRGDWRHVGKHVGFVLLVCERIENAETVAAAGEHGPAVAPARSSAHAGIATPAWASTGLDRDVRLAKLELHIKRILVRLRVFLAFTAPPSRRGNDLPPAFCRPQRRMA